MLTKHGFLNSIVSYFISGAKEEGTSEDFVSLFTPSIRRF